MANTSGIVRPSDESPGRVSGLYTITPDLNLFWPGGQSQLTFFIGSRRMGRSFAFERQGHLFQAPVGYYNNRQKWDLAPGYERDSKPDLSRPITNDCLGCHTSGAALVAGSINRYSEIAAGIQCARCHGNATDHAQLVNPRKLPARMRDSVCEQCHLAGAVRLAQPGKQLAQFRPGEDLADYIEVFTGARSNAAPVMVNGHAESLASSKCKQASGDKLWCGTCHNPHAATSDYSAACRSCHQMPHNTADCISCHMPKGRAYDGGHAVFTDHSISKRTERPFGSYFGRQPSARNLGMAYVTLALEQKSPALLEKAWPLLREAAAAKTRDPELHLAIANVLAAGGHKKEAVAYYRLSLEEDPLQPGTLLKLAALVSGGEARQLREKASSMLPPP